MRDQLLFVIAPSLAAISCLAGVVLVLLMGGRADAPQPPSADNADAGTAASRWWRYSIAFVLLAHVFAFAFPGAILRWDRQLLRLIALESVGLAAGITALMSLFVTSARQLRRHASSFDTIAATLLFLQIVSGLTIAVRYRWASSWAGVTLTPYLYSLVGLNPSVVLVARMPFLVQLHVFCAFAVLAVVVPRVAGSLVVSVRELALRAASMRRPYRAEARGVPAWTPVDVPVAAEIQLNDKRQP